MDPYATIADVIALWRPLSPADIEKVTALLPIVSDALRVEARRVGKDLDGLVNGDAAYMSVVKAVTVDVVSRVMRQSTDTEPMTQESQSALGYSWSGTYAIPGGGIANAIMKNDLKRLGLRAQRYGVIEPYEYDTD